MYTIWLVNVNPGESAMRMRTRPSLPAPDTVRDGLRKAILSGELAAGSLLRQDEIAERFGISRIPVREALRLLEAEGLVTLHPNRGAVVSALSLDEVLELLDIRIALECRALRIAIPNMVEVDFEAAENILAAYDAEPDASKWGGMNWNFHSALYAPANRPRLLAMIETNYGHVDRFTRLQVSLATGKDRPQGEHHEMLDLCRQGKVERAAKLLEDHILHTRKSLIAAVRRGASVNAGA